MRTTLVLAMVITFGSVQPALALESIGPGARAPEIAVETLDGQAVRLADHAGARAILLVFWSTWSDSSPEVLERAERLFSRWKRHGLVVLGINVDEQRVTANTAAAARAFAERLGVSFPILLDRGLVTFARYGVVAVPTSVLVHGGTILAELPVYPIAGREEFFDVVEQTVHPARPSPAVAKD